MLPIAQTFSKNDIFALIPTLPEMGSIQSQHGLRSQNANRMLTLFRKICFDGKNFQSLVPTVETPETPVKSRVFGVLKGAGKRSKCSKRHPLPTTRNQFGSNPTRVRLPPAAPARRKRHIACGEFFHFTATPTARSFCCSSPPDPPLHGRFIFSHRNIDPQLLKLSR